MTVAWDIVDERSAVVVVAAFGIAAVVKLEFASVVVQESSAAVLHAFDFVAMPTSVYQLGYRVD